MKTTREATEVNKMKLRRLELELTQYQLEKLTNIHQARLSLFERGFRKPSQNEKRKIAKALRVKEEMLFEERTNS